MYVTDTSGDVREAASVDIPSVGVTWGYHPRQTLERANPRSIVDTPQALVEFLISPRTSPDAAVGTVRGRDL